MDDSACFIKMLTKGEKMKAESIKKRPSKHTDGSPRFVSLGELLLILYTPGYSRFIQAESFECDYAGSEAGTAASLTRYGMETQFVSRLPQNPLGEAGISQLRRIGIGTDHIVRGGSRLGIAFIERGAEQRPSRVVYDRTHSSASEMAPNMFAWEKIFNNCDWFHFSGITPALSKTAANTVQSAITHAKKCNIPISCDINYRSKLWTRQEAARVMRPLVQGITCIFGNEADAKDVFGIGPESSRIETGAVDANMYKSVLTQLLETYDIKMGAFSVRRSYSAFHNDWSGVFLDEKGFYVSRCYPINHIVDRFGAGDSFDAGIIYGILTGKDRQASVEFATAASCLKHSIPGANNLISVDEVEDLVNTGGTGRVKR